MRDGETETRRLLYENGFQSYFDSRDESWTGKEEELKMRDGETEQRTLLDGNGLQ